MTQNTSEYPLNVQLTLDNNKKVIGAINHPQLVEKLKKELKGYGKLFKHIKQHGFSNLPNVKGVTIVTL